MALTNIEYGSLASSETLNSNFQYLDNRITDAVATINQSIKSILTNIATINSNFSELSGDINDSVQELSSDIYSHKTLVKNTLNDFSMKPDWSALRTVSISNYTAPSNGYILAIPNSNANGIFTVNNVEVQLKYWSSYYDNTADIITIPLKKGDVINSNLGFQNVYFLPAEEISLTDE